MIRFAAFLCILASVQIGIANAETVLAARTIRAQTILSATDIAVVEGDVMGAYAFADEVIGLESRVALYAGRPIRIEDLGPPAIIDRNQIVTLYYRTDILTLAAEGRALGRAGVGDRLRVMNLTSHQIVSGTVRADASVDASPMKHPSFLQE